MREPHNLVQWLKSFFFSFLLFVAMEYIVNSIFPVCVENYNASTFNWYNWQSLEFKREPFWSCKITYDDFITSFSYYSNFEKRYFRDFNKYCKNCSNFTNSNE